MNEWKELEIDNLPPDLKLSDDVKIFDYRIECYSYDTWVKTSHTEWWMILKEIKRLKTKYRYRKPEPKAPTHEEIMAKWWQMDNPFVWRVVTGYNRESNKYLLYDGWCSIEYFIGRKSADIPPE